MITTPQQANDLLAEGKADLVQLVREFLRDPPCVLRATNELGVAVKPAVQYERPWQCGGPRPEGSRTPFYKPF
jgi:2,4-dienoyl-CoA reductase-like NADH-dependent reductase (Old Yellow Enzyme family)